jgi:DNA mismatch repair protein MutH
MPRRDLTRPPPKDEHDLRTRAHLLAGRSLDDLAASLGLAAPGGGARTKGKVGDLLERALGATGGSHAQHDFPDLRIELKTIPLAPSGVPRESTFVCTIALADAGTLEWKRSWVRAKLSHVLWIPIVESDGGTRRIGTPLFWQPTRAQEEVLSSDFDEIMGAIGIGGIERITARVGRWLQMRPKAADGTPRAVAFGPGNERIATVARGFYLRASFTGALLRDPNATP